MKNINFKNKNILITGADGFIGSHLVEKLSEYNCNITAMAMYNSFNTWGWLESIDPYIKKNINIISGDIRDYKFVKNAITKSDIVFHLASLIAIPYSYHSPNSYLQTNVQGTLNVLEASLDSNIEKIIHTSTSEVYGDTKIIPISEQTPIISKSPYSATKIAADQLAYSYYSSFDLPVSIIRPFNTYGPRQSSRAIIPTIVTQILSGKKTIKLGSLYPTRDFSYIDDTVNGFIRIGESNQSLGEVINIGAGYEISIKDLCALIEEITKTKIKILSDKKRIRPEAGEVYRLKADNKKARKLLGWKPLYSGKSGLKKGLKETIDWFSKPTNMSRYKTNLYNI
tara:strand:+ start:641 stop:1660 length:1020 start_codon:yes stop_codon:yes gene_type:complete